MRIRSIKPEFWRSDDIDALDWDTRLVFIGLWSYVDDSGVGVDKLAAVCADLFAGDVERDPRETFARVSGALQKLSESGLILRYSVAGKAYLYVTGWNTHQRIDKPGKARYPLPTSDDAVIRDTLATPSRDSRETLAPGTGEQGNRGTGEISTPVSSLTTDRARETDREVCETGGALVPLNPPRGGRAVADRLNATAHSPQAHGIATAYATAAATPVPGDLLAKIAVAIDGCLQSGIEPAQIAAGLQAWDASPITAASQIPGFVHKAAARAPTGLGKPSAKAQSHLDAGEAVIAQMRNQK